MCADRCGLSLGLRSVCSAASSRTAPFVGLDRDHPGYTFRRHSDNVDTLVAPDLCVSRRASWATATRRNCRGTRLREHIMGELDRKDILTLSPSTAVAPDI